MRIITIHPTLWAIPGRMNRKMNRVVNRMHKKGYRLQSAIKSGWSGKLTLTFYKPLPHAEGAV